jgi:hypothetical protein
LAKLEHELHTVVGTAEGVFQDDPAFDASHAIECLSDGRPYHRVDLGDPESDFRLEVIDPANEETRGDALAESEREPRFESLA